MNINSTLDLTSEGILDNFCSMMIEDYLKRKKMTITLDAFRNEWKRPEEEKLILSWYEVVLKLRLPELIAQGNSKDVSILENLTEALIRESSVRSRQPFDTVLTGLANMPKINATSLPNIVDHHITDRDNTNRNSMIKSPTKQTFQVEVKKENSLNKNTVNNYYIKRQKDSIEKLGINNNRNILIKTTLSNEAWIPNEYRMKSLGRDLSAAKETLSAIKKREMGFEKEMKRLLVSDLEHARTEERLESTHKIPCGCCKQKFLYVNLPLKVSRKAILDIRIKWSGKLSSATVFGETSTLVLTDTTKCGAGTGVAGERQQSEDSALLGAVPRCYDHVGVCVFCAQFFQIQEDYRPSYHAIALNERKAAYIENKRREKEYWDPLKMVEKDRNLFGKKKLEQSNTDQSGL